MPARSQAHRAHRVLFVDDEKRILEALQRSLHRHRSRLSIEFAASGDEALAALAREPFDVVICDLRMPGTDGFEVLALTQSHHPDTLRIALSGQTELASTLRTMATAHQFLSKPCDGERVRQVIERACKMRALFTNERIRRVVSRLHSLPSSPELYLELTRALADPDTTADAVASIVERDLAMSAKILQIVNSAFFGLPREISSVREAVVYLGMQTIQSLVLSVEAFRPFEADGRARARDVREAQEHALLCATLSRPLAPDLATAEVAYVASLLHDVGELVLMSELPEEYETLRDERDDSLGRDPMVERQVLGVDHCEVGAYLLESWGLPLAVTEAVAFHHEPESVEHDGWDVLSIVHVADALVQGIAALRDGHDPSAALAHDYLGRLGLLEELPAWNEIAHELAERRTGDREAREA